VSVKSAIVAESAGGQGTVANPPVVAPPKPVVAPEVVAWPSCPVCGLSFADVRSTGRLGCANCYTAFKRGLLPLLDKIHGQTEHRGKVPAQAHRRQERQRQVVELRRRLNEAIQKEAYEDAARLRDEIYSLEER
jgi:protein arginine kinase activator